MNYEKNNRNNLLTNIDDHIKSKYSLDDNKIITRKELEKIQKESLLINTKNQQLNSIFFINDACPYKEDNTSSI